MQSSNVLTSSENGEWNYHAPTDRNAKCLLLTVGGIAVIGAWGDGSGIEAWYPLPKRRKDKSSVAKVCRNPSSPSSTESLPTF